jgi:hypothetical protein
MLYAAKGKLPNSDEREYTVMIGHNEDAIVALGVSPNQNDPRRMLAIAAGKSYQDLNNTQ